MYKASKYILSCLVSLKEREILRIRLAVKDYSLSFKIEIFFEDSLELLSAKLDGFSFAKGFDSARGAKVDIDYGSVSFLRKGFSLFLQRDVACEKLVYVHFNLV